MENDKRYYVYIMTNKRNNVLYVGVSNSIFRRSLEHKFKQNKNSFTEKYNIDKLVYYEVYKYIKEAIRREKQLKKWKRQWKLDLIEKENFQWRDLYLEIIG